MPTCRHYSQTLHLHIHGQPSYNGTQASRFIRVQLCVAVGVLSWCMLSLINFPTFQSKKYVVGTQNNHLYETVLLSTQNIILNQWIIKAVFSDKNHVSPSVT